MIPAAGGGRQAPLAPIEPLPDPEVRLPEPGERERATVLRHANVVDVVAGAIVPNMDVHVVRGRVVAMGEDLTAAGVADVDLAGRFLMPGLIDLHVHPGMMVGLRMDPGGMTAERVKRDLQVWLRYGVTSVQALGTDRDCAFDVQREQADGAFAGARLFTVGHGFGVRGGLPPFQMDPPGPVRVDDPEAIGQLLADLKSRGASGVKLWYDDWYRQMPKMAPEVARTIIEGARRSGLETYAHVYRLDDAVLLMDLGVGVLAHMPRDREADGPFLDKLLATGTVVLPTLTVPESNAVFPDRPEWVADPLFGRFLPPGTAEYLRDERYLDTIRQKPEYPELEPELNVAQRNTRLVSEAGAAMAFGTDGGVSNRVVGFYDHRELELLVAAGVTNADALRLATVNAAATLGQAGALGVIATGARADLVVLRGDPFEDIRSTRAIDAVWLDGVPVCGAL